MALATVARKPLWLQEVTTLAQNLRKRKSEGQWKEFEGLARCVSKGNRGSALRYTVLRWGNIARIPYGAW